jgi:heavy-metal-associated domain-containing protein
MDRSAWSNPPDGKPFVANVGRTIQLVHSLPGRTRFRLVWLAGDAAVARRIADELSRLEGVIEVRVRPRTGSVLCLHLASLGADDLAAALASVTGGQVVRGPVPPSPPELPARAGRSSVARSMLAMFRHLDRRVVSETEGRLDLATFATVALFGVSALSVLLTRRVSAPPWFNFVWWALRILRDQAFALDRPGAAPAMDGEGAVHEPSP